MARQAERREATRAALLASARASFIGNGFEATSLNSVLAGAGLSKGALYHHFSNKAELLEAVFEQVSRETVAKAQKAAAGASSPRGALTAALKAWLRAVLESEPRHVILEIGPAVLGIARARSIEEEVTQAPTRHAIESLVASGSARCEDVDLVARLLNAAVAELALIAISRELSASALDAFDVRIDALVAALLPPASEGRD